MPVALTANPLISAVTDALETVISWVGKVVNALIGTDGALAPLLPLLAIGIAVSALLLGISAVRKICWGA